MKEHALARLHIVGPLQVSAFRRRLEKVVGDKHEEIMARMGAIMATGAGQCLQPNAGMFSLLDNTAYLNALFLQLPERASTFHGRPEPVHAWCGGGSCEEGARLCPLHGAFCAFRGHSNE